MEPTGSRSEVELVVAHPDTVRIRDRLGLLVTFSRAVRSLKLLEVRVTKQLLVVVAVVRS